MNSHRRHLSPVQSAAIVLKHSDMLALGDNQYNREGVQRCTPKSVREKVEVPRGTSIKSETDVAKEVATIVGAVQLNLSQDQL